MATEPCHQEGLDQPKISALRRGRLSGFSLDRLVRFVVLLEHCQVEAAGGRVGR